MTSDDGVRLATIFRLVLDLPGDAPVADIRRVVEPRWDSLAHASLVAAIESEYSIQMNAADIDALTSYRGAVLLLQDKGVW